MSAQPRNYDLLVISDDVVGRKMAGPGIRAWELARCLARHFKVALAVPEYSSLPGKKDNLSFELTTYSLSHPSRLRKVAQRSKIVLIQGYVLSKFPFLKDIASHLIIDLYVPFPLENLFVHKWKVPDLKQREYIHHNDLRVFNEHQRDLFLGSLLSLNRINPETLDYDPDLVNLISIVPFGITEDDEPSNNHIYSEEDHDLLETKAVVQGRLAPYLNEEEPKSDNLVDKKLTGEQNDFPRMKMSETGPLRKQLPQGGKDDIVLLWGGVISNWFDPLTLIRAVKRVSRVDPRIKLFFLSTSHPNPLLPEFDLAREAVKIAQELDLFDKFVFFNEEWVDYDRRGQFFLDADIGVSIHHLHFETYFSFRTRILDYFKYELPTICTEGDCLAELVEKEQLGLVIPAGDEEALMRAILQMMENPQLRSRVKNNIHQMKHCFYWSAVTKPLVYYCQKILAGKVKKGKKSSAAQVASLLAKPKHPLREIGKRIFGFSLMRWSFPLTAKVKRLLRM